MTSNKELFEDMPVGKAILTMALPTILSQMVTLLYNLADTFFVGHTNNPAQIAALTLSFPIFMSLTMLGNLFGIGANSLISRSLGNKDRETARQTSTFSLYGGLFVTACWIIILQVFFPQILHVIGAKTEEVYTATKAYLTWTVVCGGLPTVASLLLAHNIRGEGNTRQASIGVALGGILNILLDPIFVQIMGMGAAGAGLATCLSNIVSMCYMISVVLRHKDSVIVWNPLKLRFVPYIMKEVILVGLPAAMIVILGSSANIVLTHFMSDYGEVSVAAYGIVQKIGTVTIQITVGLTQGIMPLLGYNYGARNKTRVRSVTRWSIGILAVYTLLCVVIIEVCARYLFMAFTGEINTINLGVVFVRIWILCAFGMCFTNLFNSFFQAMGHWVEALTISIIRQLLILIPILILFNKIWGSYGLIISQPVADTVALIVGFALYIKIMAREE